MARILGRHRLWLSILFYTFTCLVIILETRPTLAHSPLDTLAPNTLSSSPLEADDGLAFLQHVLEDRVDTDYCRPTGKITDSACDFATIDALNEGLYLKLQELVQTTFFRYYKLNLYKRCPFWQEDGLCMNRDCSVGTVEEHDMPNIWPEEDLGAIRRTSTTAPVGQCEARDDDFCVMDDLHDEESVYVDLMANPERFTGYAGPSAARVWRSIYEENCFGIVHKMTEGCETCNNIMNGVDTDIDTDSTSGPKFPPNPFVSLPTSSEELSPLLQSLAELRDGGGPDNSDVCLEKRVFYRLISGLHSSISIHICGEYFDRNTGNWGPNLSCFITRIGSHPERLQNVYFNYVLLLRAVAKLEPYLRDYGFVDGITGKQGVKPQVDSILQQIASYPPTFEESSLFQEDSFTKQEFRDRFRNVSRIMDCVGCEKCRLWGKVQVSGLGTALKILFGDLASPSSAPLQRTEIIALFNTLNRFSESLMAIAQFRDMYQAAVKGDSSTAENIHHSPPAKQRLDQATSKVSLPAPTSSSAQSIRKDQNATDRTSTYTIVQCFKVGWYRCMGSFVGWIVSNLKEWNIPVPVVLESMR